MTISNQITPAVAPPPPVINYSSCWFALRTRSRHEKVAAHHLELGGIDTYVPLVSKVNRWSDRKKLVETPLFPGYVFAFLSYTSEQRIRALRSHGVVGFVGPQGQGTPIPSDQIEGVRRIIDNKIDFHQEECLRVGQRVRIRGGCMDGLEGVVINCKGMNTLVISIGVIQRSLCINLDGYSIEVI